MPDYWPQRLIHVPSMTSAPRDEFNVYRAAGIEAKEPIYNILSYTWGRWVIRDGSRDGHRTLPLTGTPWAIPAVEESHFTADGFLKVVRAVAGLANTEATADWVWVDIGCIDQRDNEQAAVEIGRQASIFKRAQCPFVWLSHLPATELGPAVRDAEARALELSAFLDEPPRGRTNARLVLGRVGEGLQKALGFIFSDPWFSSLWTLQEVILRDDAIVLSAEGEPIVWDTEPSVQYMFLTMFINLCRNIYRDLALLEQRLSPLTTVATTGMDTHSLDLGYDGAPLFRDVKAQILRAGFQYLFSNNPNVQYGVARYRTTSRRTDRVYAIMQTYGVRVGKAARPGADPELDDLVDEFAGAINTRSAILGQLFLHTAAPTPGKSWRITENSIVPGRFLYYKRPNDLCKFEVATGSGPLTPVRASGKWCRLDDLISIAQEAGRHDFSVDLGWGLRFRAYFDHHIAGNVTNQWADQKIHIRDTRPKSGPVMITRRDIQVLLLGDIEGERLSRQKRFERRNIGLLLFPHHGDQGDDGYWQRGVSYERLGVCIWTPYYDWDYELLHRITWHNIDGLELH